MNSSAPGMVLLVKLEEKEEREKEDFYLSAKETLTIQPLGKSLVFFFFFFFFFYREPRTYFQQFRALIVSNNV